MGTSIASAPLGSSSEQPKNGRTSPSQNPLIFGTISASGMRVKERRAAKLMSCNVSSCKLKGKNTERAARVQFVFGLKVKGALQLLINRYN